VWQVRGDGLCGPLRISAISAFKTSALNAEIVEIRRDRVYEATINVKNFFRHTFVLTPAAPMNLV
jgi:hypothetical protein